MARQLFKQVLAMPVYLCLSQVGYTAEHALKTNPFARSVEVQEEVNAAASQTAAQKDSIPFVLRGTMMAGPQSLANISGVIVPLGEVINGYRLVGVHEREVVLLKDNDRRVLTVDGDTEGDR